jgi:hypothetical protein
MVTDTGTVWPMPIADALAEARRRGWRQVEDSNHPHHLWWRLGPVWACTYDLARSIATGEVLKTTKQPGEQHV